MIERHPLFGVSVIKLYLVERQKILLFFILFFWGTFVDFIQIAVYGHFGNVHPFGYFIKGTLDGENRPDHVVEIAGGQALRQYGVRVLKQGLKLIAVSVGALADDAL